MKARQVKGLKPDGWLAENARRIVLVRLDELLSFGDDARDPDKVTELHDMRIAAKRLRYLLEIHEPLFGFAAGRAVKTVRDLQELLGEIHDCDELMPLIRRRARALRRDDVATLVAAAGEEAEDLDPAVLQSTTNGELYRGLESLMAYTGARREILHARFVRRWDELERHDFAGKLEWDIERATSKAMGAVVAREEREEAEREAARVAAELERAAAEMERRAAQETERLERQLQAEEPSHPDGSNGHDPATSTNGQADSIDSVVAADETTSQSGQEEGNSPGA
jgi:hypothetical protein